MATIVENIENHRKIENIENIESIENIENTGKQNTSECDGNHRGTANIPKIANAANDSKQLQTMPRKCGEPRSNFR